MKRLLATLAVTAMVLGSAAQAQAPKLGSHQEKMAAFDFMHGEWRGEASSFSPSGKTTFTQTERVGPMLQGDVLLVEGLAYDETGTPLFNALGVISYDARTDSYSMQSYTSGRSGNFPVTLTNDGYQWEMPAGPNAIVRYSARFTETTWSQTGQYIREGAEPVTNFTMDLQKIGDTDWPNMMPVAAK